MEDSEFDLVIEPGKVERQYWTDIWRYRELFYFLAWRDLIVRYKQTTIGVLWSILRPVLTMLIFVLIFNKVAKLESKETPYAILVYAALLPWQLFSSALSESSTSLTGNSNLISKVYFPRMIVPLSTIIVALVDFMLSGVVLLVVMSFYSYLPALKILFLPLFITFALLVSVSSGLFFAALNVKYRDTRFVVPFLIQFGLYLSPVGFSSEIVPREWRLLYSLNPMVGVIDGFRWCIIREVSEIYIPGLVVSATVTVGALILSIKYFRSTEKKFADGV